jgi:class 3 adenylate cyclase
MASDRINRQIERLLDEAEQAFASRDWELVRQRARDVLAFDPGNQEAEAFLSGAARVLESEAATGTDAAESEEAASRARLEQYIPRELLTKLEAARNSGGLQGERRVVTMLFCDVTGSTAAAEKLDPEEWSQIMNGAFQHLITPIYRY